MSNETNTENITLHVTPLQAKLILGGLAQARMTGDVNAVRQMLAAVDALTADIEGKLQAQKDTQAQADTAA